MTIRLLTVGRIQPIFKQAQDEFIKRLSRFCRFEIIEVPDKQAPENLSPAEKEAVMLAEAELLQKKITKGDYIIAMDSRGEMLSSDSMAQKLQALQSNGHSSFAFLIGGSLGLHASLLKQADSLLSLSPMTFTHSLARIVLSEQLYRSFKISSNQPYHK